MGYRYLGNKHLHTEHIVNLVSSLVPRGASVADPMCGTASVSAALAQSGFSVTAADQLTFAVLHAKARVQLKRAPRFPAFGGYASALEYLNSVRRRRGLFFREYSDAGTPTNGCQPRKYFTGANAGKIDAIRAAIRDLSQNGEITQTEEDLLLHNLILASNRVANIAGTYGYYCATWNPSSLAPLKLIPTVFRRTDGKHNVMQGKVEELAERIEVDVCYLDPPYTKRQYAGNYHILETIAQQDQPDPVGEGGLRDWYDQYSDFCSKRKVREAFLEVLKRLEVPHVLISYSEDALIPPDEMIALLDDLGVTKRYEFANKRFRSNGGKNGHVKEHLYHVRLR